MSSEEDNSDPDVSNNDFSDEEDDDIEDEIERKRSVSKDASRKKKKAKTTSMFIEEEAEVDEDDEEDEDAEDASDLYDDEKEEAEQEAEIMEQNFRSVKSGMPYEQDDADEIVYNIKKRHKQSQRRYDDEAGDEEIHTEVSQQSLLPSVNDPKLWLFKCKPGREQHIIVSLMNKFIVRANSGTPLSIKSAILSSSKGFIYVEAERESHAKDAVTGLRDVFSYSMNLVPVHEMSTVLDIQKRKEPIKPGTWARIKRAGIYKGDLCKVIDIPGSGTKAIVKMIPRLDINFEASKNSKKGQRPPQKFFNELQIPEQAVSRRFPGTGEMMDFYDSNFYKNGFLYKEMNIQAMLLVEDVNPTLDELQKFNARQNKSGKGYDDDVDEDLPISNSSTHQIPLAKGDTVRVIEGDLRNLLGVVVSSSSAAGTVKVMPLHEEIRDTVLDFATSQLEKCVKVGDHVKVIEGRYAGDTGTVLSVDESDGVPIAIILSDSGSKELQVLVRDIQESSEISSGLDSLAGKELYDLVQLTNGGVGVIVHVGRENFKVLTKDGTTMEVANPEIQKKLNFYRPVIALDRNRQRISVGESVTVLDGAQKGQTGTIQHIFKSFVFIHSNKTMENAGLFVCRARSLIIAGSKARNRPNQSGLDMLGGGNSNQQQMQYRRRDFKQTPGEDSLMGLTVRINKGRWKGYIGMVIEQSDQIVKVEIHSKNQVVRVNRSEVGQAGNRDGEFVQTPRTHSYSASTPIGSQTPTHAGSMTPRHTPFSEASTPVPHTPSEIWNASGDSMENDMSMAASYGTPLESILTPAAEAATPGIYQATTPGMLSYSPAIDLGGPTTPGMDYNPTTPAGHFGTPGASFHSDSVGTPKTPAGMTPAPSTPAFDLYDNTHFNQQTNSGENKEVWITPDVEVCVTASGDYYDMRGTIREVQSENICTVDLFDRDQILRISAESLRPVMGGKLDHVLILEGKCAGLRGHVVGINVHDGIVKLDVTADIHVIDVSRLAKLST